jgi:hypothetical protein
MNLSPQQLERLLARRQLLAERSDLLKEYLLRPIRNAQVDRASMLSAEDIKRAQVLPEDLFSAMQAAYHKAERDLARLEKLMDDTGKFVVANGTYRIL